MEIFIPSFIALITGIIIGLHARLWGLVICTVVVAVFCKVAETYLRAAGYGPTWGPIFYSFYVLLPSIAFVTFLWITAGIAAFKRRHVEKAP